MARDRIEYGWMERNDTEQSRAEQSGVGWSGVGSNIAERNRIDKAGWTGPDGTRMDKAEIEFI